MENHTTHTSHTNQTHNSEHNHNNQNEVIFASLAYIIFFLPLIFTPNSELGKFHANQGLILLICTIVASVVLTVTVIGMILLPLVQLAAIIFAVLGILNATKNKKEALPVIGHLFTLIK